ncbi:GTPase Era [Francisella tularensis]|uniref:GTPase Era n=1 Tax=Francisella tularensis TaxID=263 RepID=UPI00028EA15F|nr:GTPase Era [Francisella tularensis]AJI62492.1 GTP-binding protein Era [Francisella tularensis subsp. tularensis]EKM92380.1 GTPase Era [Francisella tularensis subsp. tularensis 80700103]KFJ63831.1 GTP-binding protein Era [Francisella tularensis]MBK2015961.1 GTPase Era [Francisella tularensis subsp. tularensis]MBK2016655.1 GTPase Era [Francisella tularensis subsp. tularensis]
MKKCGYISIIGRPNVGKSTLLNNILKYKVSITSRKPQTTRHQITGIKTLGDTQFIYVDTPGIHIKEPKAINKFMNKAATTMFKDVDVILFVVEMGKWTELEDNIVEKLKHSEIPIFLVVNKVDKKKSLEAAMFIESIKEKLSFYDVIYVSAKQGHNINELESRIEKLLPESEYFFYEEDQITDRSIKFMVAEIIREKIMRTIGSEVPYQIAVEIDSYKVDQEKNIVYIYASILVERDSQKGIVIGAKGTKLKKIGTDSRIDIERLVGMQVNLKTHVKVKSGWSDDDRALKSLGYDLI